MKKNKVPSALRVYQHAIVAVDSVIFAIKDNSLKIVLLKIVRKPLTNRWAVPGGLVLPTENLENAVERHITTKTGIKKNYFEQLGTFGDINRDPRGRVVSVAYLSLLSNPITNLSTTKDYSDIQWFDVKKLPALAYDHTHIIKTALQRLRSKLEYTNIAQYLLPSTFTLRELQNVYELVLGKKIDKRNFRKKILSLNILKKAQKKAVGSFRPAELYCFKNQKPAFIEIL